MTIIGHYTGCEGEKTLIKHKNGHVLQKLLIKNVLNLILDCLNLAFLRDRTKAYA
jgi:hypothetical protein